MKGLYSVLITLIFCLKLPVDVQGQPRYYDPEAISHTVSFMTEDSVWVFADLYPARTAGIPKEAPVIILMHQSASNSEEYRPIAPKLVKAGFTCLAIDARGGGQNYGRHNRTNANLPHHGGGPQAFWDFKAALKYLDDEGYTGPITMWGSSYSAGRMFALLQEKPERVVAGLSFSPGRGFSMTGPNGEPPWCDGVMIPIFMTWAPDELDDSKREQFSKVTSPVKTLFIQEKGVHGSSTLRPDKNREGYEAIWPAVMEFINEHSR